MNKGIKESRRKLTYPLIVAVGLGGLHQYLFFGHLPGISVPLFWLLLYAYVWKFGRKVMRPLEVPGILLAGAGFLLSFSYALFDNPVFFTLNLIALPSLIAWQLTYMLSDRKRDWYDPMLIVDGIGYVLKQTILHIPDVFLIFRLQKKSEQTSQNSNKNSAGKQILSGLLIAIPILTVVLMLLFSADGVLRNLAGEIPLLFTNLTLGTLPIRLIWAVIIGVFLFTYLAGFLSPRRKPLVQGPAMPSIEEPFAKFQPLVTITLMIIINLVYLLFVAFQFSYLFGAWQGVLPQSSSYAEYARSGFGELIGVTFINFALLLLGMYATNSGEGKMPKVLNGLLYFLVFCSVAMLGSAFARLLLYEEAYGYTRLRFLVHAFMIFLFLLLMLFALCIKFRKLPLGRWSVALAVCAYVALNYSLMDRTIAQLNLQREAESADWTYLMGLSADATPVLVKESLSGNQEIQHWINKPTLQRRDGEGAWQSWNLSRAYADYLLRKNADSADLP
ncbi:DUF4153 domain-containing protein [Saccharibacillus sp. JS10]|uniref:DUF4153 domain-containing protein n=1 Tax=Saccharibacillus sp. JS10 TaxID=2950552 RepID=UPI00210C19CB|nr:DUF4173 domain-containing protein [Saccharibacillus sp. JS10]MCQ4087958.1 DUF4173 domain-containing protein [Saccharibacillus sp. JS10]